MQLSCTRLSSRLHNDCCRHKKYRLLTLRPPLLPRLVCRDSSSKGTPEPDSFALAPSKPTTPYGEMLAYYQAMRPELFKSAVDDQLARLRDEKEAKEEAEQAERDAKATNSLDLALARRMEEVRALESRATLEDLMYVCVLDKFVSLGVEMMPRMDGVVTVQAVNLQALTEGIHSREALELVREHLISVMGPATLQQFSNVAVKMSKFQMAQVYAASVMFGYFLRRVDARFQLERVAGTLAVSREDAVARLEALWAQADTVDVDEDSDRPSSPSPPSSPSGPTTPSTSAITTTTPTPSPPESDTPAGTGGWGAGTPLAGSSAHHMRKHKSALRRYIESFDQAAMLETARIVSAEGAALVERQTGAVLGDIKRLTQQIQQAVGTDAVSMEEVMARMAHAVKTDAVETVTMTVGTQRRVVLEAVAFGTFLRDVETYVDHGYSLLTPLPPPRLPPANGMSGADL